MYHDGIKRLVEDEVWIMTVLHGDVVVVVSLQKYDLSREHPIGLLVQNLEVLLKERHLAFLQ